MNSVAYQQNGRSRNRIDDQILGEIPINSLDAEQSVLGAMMLSGDAIPAAIAELPAGEVEFHSDVNGIVFLTMCEMHSQAIPVDPVTLASELEKRGKLSDIGGPAYVIKLSEAVPHSANVRHYASIVHDRFVRRSIERAVKEIAALSRDLTRDPLEVLTLATAATVSIEKIANRTADWLFPVMTSAELDAAELRTIYLVENILAAMQPCILAASKKSLKTTLAILLTLCLASGSQFLGRFRVFRAVRVALMSGESGDAVIQETARRIARSLSWKNLADYEKAIWSFSLPKLGRPQTKAELVAFIKKHRLEVLIIDPAYLCLDLGDDAGNLFQVGAKLIELTEVMRETACTIILVHHNRKSTRDVQFEPPELESIAWSGFQEWARQWILLGRREAYDPENAGSHKLWLVTGGSAGHSGKWGLDIEEGSSSDPTGRRWEVTVEKASAIVAGEIDQRETKKEEQARIKAEKQLAGDCERLFKEYQKRPEGDTEKYFRERSRLNGVRSGAANDQLLMEGRIESCEITKNGRKYSGFRIIAGAQNTTGSDRVSTGSRPACPDGEHGAGLTPLRGSPGPAHRDSSEIPFDDMDEIWSLSRSF